MPKAYRITAGPQGHQGRRKIIALRSDVREGIDAASVARRHHRTANTFSNGPTQQISFCPKITTFFGQIQHTTCVKQLQMLDNHV